ncbi:Regulator of sigma-W protease RasP [Candidatus Izimaplasma bacterium HR1]|jgi:regulator of sigma E protease|uniref:RIP metalloprotease RseP n=1 Tax=Candidatus Izimoplasma sp. HR1 TaxID=1541959 RepID=UPI0004F6F7BD|nr:Regulator of sigma-W protease RasP [Candidatus Izimaplasma bacterium HR1]
MVLVNILVFVLSLSTVIILHEVGHFVMARRAGILCHEFSLGMGPVIWKKKIGETLYSVKLIPIGGYVMMSGEEIEDEIIKVGESVRLDFEGDIVSKIILDHEDERFENLLKVTVEKIDLKGQNKKPLYINEYEVKQDAFYVMKNRELQIAPYDRGFNSKTLWQRFLAIFAGPGMNFILALVVFLFVNLIVGFPNMDETAIGTVGATYPAGGVIEVGDVITEVEGVSVSTWDELSRELDKNAANRDLDIVVIRDGEEMDLELTPILYFFTLGLHSNESAVEDLTIAEVPEGTKAYEAGFVGGDQLVSIDGVDLTDWASVIVAIDTLSEEAYVEGKLVEIEVLREDVVLTLEISEPYSKIFLETQNISVVDARIGISPEYNFNFGQAVLGSFSDVVDSSKMIFTTIGLLIDNDDAGAGVGVENLAGPLGIYQITSAALSNGFISLLSWIGLLSVNLGIINLLPIPALDGGRIVFLGYEAITRRKPNRKFENTLNYIVFVLLMGFFIFITYNDILRLFNIN